MFAKTVLAAAVLATIAAVPAQACAFCGGIKLNGVSLNGITFNGPGIVFQGRSLNGTRFNGPGLVVQGRTLNGITFNGPGLVLQGRLLNGVKQNGPLLQGPQFNGASLPGQQGINVGGYHGVGLNGQVIAIEF